MKKIKYFSFIFLFILTLLQRISYAKENLKSTSENDDEYIKFTEFTVKKPNYINFKYDNPINGIKVTGVFKPKGWGCRGTVTGEVTFTFTRLSDKKSFKFNLKNEGLFDSSICKEKELNEDGEGKCIIRKNLIFKYDNNINIFEEKEDQTEFITQLLSIIDIDFDGKEEIIIARSCGIRSNYEYEAYKFYNTPDKFDIDREQLQTIEGEEESSYGPRRKPFYFRENSIFDKKNKTVTVDFPWSACGNTINLYKADGKGFKLIQKIEIDLGNSGDCISRTYKVDLKGNLKLIDTKVIG